MIQPSGTTRLDAGDFASPQITFGVIADIQYAPIPDGYSYGGVPRYYRHSLETARHAAEHFQKDNVSLVLNLGDIIDGKCQDIEAHGGDQLPEGTDPGLAAVDDVLRHLSIYNSGPILHTYGNHELYNLDRLVLGEKLGIPFVREPCGDLVGYRSHVHNSVRFVVLDTYDIARMQRCPESSRKHKEATKLLAKHNPNFPQFENSPQGMTGVNRRFVAFNGGVDAPQLEWLQETLRQAREAREKVIVLSHQPILPGSSSPVCLVWNYQEVLAVLREFSDVVVVSLSGHAHTGGYKRDKSGIHFRVVEAALQSPSPVKTYGLVDVFDDRLIIRGFGDCSSAVYDFDHTTVL
jgi:manganese-dependent ADP-ribose/CDP-alcohol diphosphatase